MGGKAECAEGSERCKVAQEYSLWRAGMHERFNIARLVEPFHDVNAVIYP
jgi:hypothetical protein